MSFRSFCGSIGPGLIHLCGLILRSDIPDIQRCRLPRFFLPKWLVYTQFMEKHGKTMEKHGKNMEKHGKTWKKHGKTWKNMENTWKNMENNMEKHGKTWKNMETHGKTWKNMEKTWKNMEKHGTSMELYSQFISTYDMYGFILWYLMVIVMRKMTLIRW